jgi:hypothetical protein
MKRIIGALHLLLGLSVIIAGVVPENAVAQSWTSSGPLPRVLHSAVLDTVTDRMIVFGGGLDPTVSTSQHFNDVWRLNSVGGASLSWSQVHPAGASPSARWGHSAGYDPSSNRMMIFGGAEGFSSPCANDVWALTNANGNGGTSAWTQLAPSGSLPPARTTQGGVYDPASNTFIIYGGQDCFSTTFSDIWVLSNANGVSGTPVWTELFPAGGPGARQAVSVVYDFTTNELILFGGSDGVGGIFNDVWVLSNANGSGGTPVWTELLPSGTLPAARGGNSATYDLANNRLTVFGGSSSTAALGDVWVLTNANGTGGTPAWTQLAKSSASFPEARSAHTAVYNSSTNKMIVFGGQLATSDTNDVFVLNKANGQ